MNRTTTNPTTTAHDTRRCQRLNQGAAAVTAAASAAVPGPVGKPGSVSGPAPWLRLTSVGSWVCTHPLTSQ